MVRDATRACLELFMVMVPIMIAVKILTAFNLVQYLAMPLEPVMRLLGLPAQTGLVWASAMLVNIYTAMVVYAALIPDMGVLSVAQVTVLCALMLVAHNLPVELRITQKCGARLAGQLALRVGGAMLLGLLLHACFSLFGLFEEPSRMLWTPPENAPTLAGWALGQVRSLLSIYLLVTCLMALMRLLDFLGITRLFNMMLKPLLRFMGIGREAATITIIGLTMGISYGGGLMLHEARQGRLSRRDLTASMSLMGLSHALIEDTLLTMLLGAHMIGTFWGRLLFSLLLVALLMRLWPDRERVARSAA